MDQVRGSDNDAGHDCEPAGKQRQFGHIDSRRCIAPISRRSAFL